MINNGSVLVRLPLKAGRGEDSLILEGHCLRNSILEQVQTNNKASWWRHQIGTLSALLDLYWGKSRWVPLTKASDAVFFMFSLICAWTNARTNNRDTGNMRRHRIHYDVTVMSNPHHWPFVRGIQQCSMASLHKGQLIMRIMASFRNGTGMQL